MNQVEIKPIYDAPPAENQNLDDHACEILKICSNEKWVDFSKVADWLELLKIQMRSDSIEVTLNQFSALTTLYRTRRTSHQIDADLRLSIESLYVQAFKRLSQNPDEAQTLDRLKKSALRKYPREQRLIYQSVFHEEHYTLSSALKLLWQDYLLQPRDVVTLLTGFFLLAMSGSFQHLVGGCLLGYIFSSTMEFLVHRYIGHANPKQKDILKKLGPIGRDMLNFNLEHSVHHGSVQQNYVDIFAPKGLNAEKTKQKKKDDQNKVDQFLLKKGGPALLKMVHNSNYGLSSSNIYRTQIFFLPVTVLFLVAFYFLTGTQSFSLNAFFMLGYFSFSQMWILTSSSYHPYLHMTEEQVELRAPWYWRLFLKSRFSRLIAQTHRMHHRHSGKLNQNLNIGFDFFVHWTPINTAELIELKQAKVIF